MNKEYLLSDNYTRDMMSGFDGTIQEFIDYHFDAEPKTENYNIRHFQLTRQLGGWRWKGVYTYRELFANIIFNDPSEKTWLEECLHPPVYHQLRQLSAKAKSPYHIWSVPLLIETGAYQEVDRVLVVDAPEMQQIERIQERASMTVDQVYAIISTQVPFSQ